MWNEKTMPWSFMDNRIPHGYQTPLHLFLPVLWICVLISGLIHCPRAFSYETHPFHGQIDFVQKKLELVVGDGNPSLVSLRLVSLSEDNFHVNLNLEHIKTALFDLSTELEGDLTLVDPSIVSSPSAKEGRGDESSEPPERSWKGQVQSRYSLLNQKPMEELSGTFEIKNRLLYISDLSVGLVHLQGFWELTDPQTIDFAIQFKDVSLKNFIALCIDDPNLEAQGLVSGDLQISGQFPRLVLKGNLASYAGQLGDLSYDSIVLNLKGQWPVVKLEDSTVTESDGMSFRIDGGLDLSSQETLKKDISALSKSALVTTGDSHWEWTIKRKENHEDASSELKYFLRKKDQKNQSPSKEDSDLFGVEQKIKF